MASFGELQHILPVLVMPISLAVELVTRHYTASASAGAPGIGAAGAAVAAAVFLPHHLNTSYSTIP